MDIEEIRLESIYLQVHDIIVSNIENGGTNLVDYTLHIGPYAVYILYYKLRTLRVTSWSFLNGKEHHYPRVIPASLNTNLFSWLEDHFSEEDLRYHLTKIVIDGL